MNAETKVELLADAIGRVALILRHIAPYQAGIDDLIDISDAILKDDISPLYGLSFPNAVTQKAIEENG